jgi:acetylornithine deacetylase
MFPLEDLPAVARLTHQLVAVPSLSGSEAAVAEWLTEWLRAKGYFVSHQQVGVGVGVGVGTGVGAAKRHNVLVTLDASSRPEVLLSTHLDTVPPFLPPRVEGAGLDAVLYGRGVIDAKGAVAAMLQAFERLAARRASGLASRVGLLFLVGEETTNDGARASAQGFAPQVRYLINGEPTDGVFARAMKGVLGFELRAHGVAGHSAYPEVGESAIHALLDVIASLRGEAWPITELGATTLNVGKLEGGVAGNVIAAEAAATLVMRPTADTVQVWQRVCELLGFSTSTSLAELAELEAARLTRPLDRNASARGTMSLKVSMQSAPISLGTLHDRASKVVAFGCDIPHLLPVVAGRSDHTFLVGPGSILDAHTAHERVAVRDLVAAEETYLGLIEQLLEPARTDLTGVLR